MIFYANESDYITFLLKTPQWLSIPFREKATPLCVCVCEADCLLWLPLALSAPDTPCLLLPPAVLFLPTLGPFRAVSLPQMLSSSFIPFVPGHCQSSAPEPPQRTFPRLVRVDQVTICALSVRQVTLLLTPIS